MKNPIKTFVIDLFCGAGGTSTAIFEAGTNIEVVACINHDKNAILSHLANYPNCLHFTEDIRTIALQPLVDLINQLRRLHPGCKIAIWASLECTNHSGAKGGQSRDADSRSLADHLIRYIEALNPDFLWIENVREFMDWGPLQMKEGKKSTRSYCELAVDKKGNYIFVPVKELKSIHYKAWVDLVKSYGFEFDHKLLNSADFGGRTSRKRYFAQFAKDISLISWPAQTHAKVPTKKLNKWKPVRDVLDLGNEGESIFNRKKPYVERSLERFYNGMVKHVEEGGCLVSYYNNLTIVGLGSPCGTLTTKDRFSKIHFIINPSWFNKSSSSIDNPAPTIVARQDKAPLSIVLADFGKASIEILDTDSPFTKKIKEFMIINGISDVKVRMLTIDEMLRIQGFPTWYKLIGTQAQQKKYIGNSVEVTVGKVMFQAIDTEIQKYSLAA